MFENISMETRLSLHSAFTIAIKEYKKKEHHQHCISKTLSENSDEHIKMRHRLFRLRAEIEGLESFRESLGLGNVREREFGGQQRRPSMIAKAQNVLRPRYGSPYTRASALADLG